MKNLTSRQAGILMFFSMIALKFITFPSVYSKYTGVNGYLAVSFNLLIDLIVLGVLMWVSAQHKNLTIKELLNKLFGKIVTRIVFALLFVMFFIKSAFLIKELQHHLLNMLFVKLDFYYFAVPIVLLMAFIISKSLRALGRSAEVFFPLVLLGVLITILIPYKYMDFTNLMPILENGTQPIFDATFHCSFATGDFFIYLIIIGNIKLEKNTNKTIYNYTLLGALLVVLFYVVFSSLYGDMGYMVLVAVGDLPFFASFPSSVGRIDWITINIWMLAVIFQAGMLLYAGLYSLNNAAGFKRKSTGIIIISVVLFAFLYFLHYNLSDILDVVTSYWFSVFNIIFQLFFPTFLFTFTLIKSKRGKSYENNKKVFTK